MRFAKSRAWHKRWRRVAFAQDCRRQSKMLTGDSPENEILSCGVILTARIT